MALPQPPAIAELVRQAEMSVRTERTGDRIGTSSKFGVTRLASGCRSTQGKLVIFGLILGTREPFTHMHRVSGCVQAGAEPGSCLPVMKDDAFVDLGTVTR